MLLAISDAIKSTQTGIFWLQGLTALLTFAGIVFSGIMTYLMAKLKGQQELAAKEVSTVKKELKETGEKVEVAAIKTVEQ